MPGGQGSVTAPSLRALLPSVPKDFPSVSKDSGLSRILPAPALAGFQCSSPATAPGHGCPCTPAPGSREGSSWPAKDILKELFLVLSSAAAEIPPWLQHPDPAFPSPLTGVLLLLFPQKLFYELSQQDLARDDSTPQNFSRQSNQHLIRAAPSPAAPAAGAARDSGTLLLSRQCHRPGLPRNAPAKVQRAWQRLPVQGGIVGVSGPVQELGGMILGVPSNSRYSMMVMSSKELLSSPSAWLSF